MMSRYAYYKKNCVQCGREFRASRSDAKFCGPDCRKTSSRRKEAIDRLSEKTMDNLRWLVSQAELYPDLDFDVRARLLEISEQSLRLAKRMSGTVTPATVTDKHLVGQ